MEAFKFQLLVTCIGSYITCIRFFMFTGHVMLLCVCNVIIDVADGKKVGRWHYECHAISYCGTRTVK